MIEEPGLVARGRRLALTAAIAVGAMDAGSIFYYVLFSEKISWGSVSFSAFCLIALGLLWMGETWARWLLGIRCLLAGVATLAICVFLMKRFAPVILLTLLLVAVLNVFAGSVFLFVESVKQFIQYQRERYRD